MRKYIKGILNRTQYEIFPSFFAYEVRSIAVDIQKIMNDRTVVMVSVWFRVEAKGLELIDKVIPPI